MAACCADGIACWHDPRTNRITVFNRLFQADVIAVFGPNIAHGGKASLEHGLRCADRRHTPEAVGKFKAAIAANIGGAVEMDMHVNEAGQYGFAGHVYMRNVAAPFYRAGIGDIGDAAICTDKNSRKINRFTVQNIDHLVSSNDRCLRLCSRRQNKDA